MRYRMHHELLNGLTMLPGIFLAWLWPVHGSCSVVPYAYAAVCLSSMAYHTANYVVGYLHDGFLILDVVTQMLCCACITYNGWLGPTGAVFILGMALGGLGCRRRHAIFLAATSIIITSGPRGSSLLWALAFLFYVSGKLSAFRHFHVLFHIVGHVAVHCTAANMRCYGLPVSRG